MKQWNAQRYGQEADYVSQLGAPLLDLLQAQSGEHILDLGCGDGTLGLQIAQSGATVLGIDSSVEMVSAAQASGLAAQVGSGEQLDLIEEFDAVFTNAALHWMTDYTAVILGVHNALKPRGRFVGEFGGAGNIQAIVDAVDHVFQSNPKFGSFTNPWYFPSDTDYKIALEAGGFQVETIALIPRPTPIPAGIIAWLEIFLKQAIAHLSPVQQVAFFQAVEARLKPQLYCEEKGWVADYVRLRFVATKR